MRHDWRSEAGFPVLWKCARCGTETLSASEPGEEEGRVTVVRYLGQARRIVQVPTPADCDEARCGRVIES